MTSEVEKLILDKHKDYISINFKEKISYLIYREIWNFILETLKYNPHRVRIDLNIKESNNNYSITNPNDINYFLYCYKERSKWTGYYENCDNYRINNIINSTMDIDILLNLLEKDNFIIKKDKVKDELILNIMIDKSNIKNIINETLLKNGKVKKLTKEV